LSDTTQQLEEMRQENKRLREQQNVEDIPALVDDKIGAVKVGSLFKINEYDRRGYSILASRFGELIRRKLASEGKASIRFYVLSKDRSTNIEYMVPISFTVDMQNRVTDMILDEADLS
jgi:hypothetical protein